MEGNKSITLEDALQRSGLFEEKCRHPDDCQERGRVVVAIANPANADDNGEIMISTFCVLHVPGDEIAKVFG